MSMKNSSDTIGIRTRYLPACGTDPQPTAPYYATNAGKTHTFYVLPDSCVIVINSQIGQKLNCNVTLAL
jgi:hypothetical protein